MSNFQEPFEEEQLATSERPPEGKEPAAPVAPPYEPRRPRRRRPPSVFWPIMFIAAGILLLLSNLGYLPPLSWGVLWRLWPLLIIALGIDLLIGQRSVIGAIVSAVLICVLVGVIVLVALFAQNIPAVSDWIGPLELPQWIQQPEFHTRLDVSQPYCPELRNLIIESAKKIGLRVRDKAVLVCTEGPRFETPAEIEMFRRLGCDVVGMTGVPEAVLARELEMCYAAFCFVSNMAAGIQEHLTPLEVPKVSEEIMPKLEQALIETIKALPLQRKGNCSCADALGNSRVK